MQTTKPLKSGPRRPFAILASCFRLYRSCCTSDGLTSSGFLREYVVFRDGTLLLAVIFGLFTLNPDLMADIKIGLPFVPLGTVALSAALAVKVFKNAEDVNKSFRLATSLVAIGFILNTIGFVFVMEAPGDEYNLGRMVFWQTLRSLRSNANPNLSLWTFYIAVALLSVIGVYCFVKFIRRFGQADAKQSRPLAN